MDEAEVYYEVDNTSKPEKRTLEVPGLDFANDSIKKPKVDEDLSHTSKVIHIRHLPIDVTDREVRSLATLFGRVNKLLMLNTKNQALIEMADLDDAIKMVTHYSNFPPTIGRKRIYLQFSNHQELKNSSVPISGSVPERGMGSRGMMENEEEHAVLRVIVDQMSYPITIDILHEIFSKYGHVLKIVTFSKNGQFHALIQFGSADQARRALMNLDGQSIYTGCCNLRIDYSNLTNLTVRQNDEKARDYTKSDGPVDFDKEHLGRKEMMSPMHFPRGRGDPGMSPGSDAMQQIARIHELRTMADILQRQLDRPPSPRGHHMGYASPSYGREGPPSRERGGGGVVLVSNLNEEMITNYALFILFGCFGDVIRVKILFNKKDTALIQFAEPFQAQTAMNHLNDIMVYGRPLHVVLSKYSSVQMPKDGSSEGGLTKDYSDSNLHRFKRPGSKNIQHICPPSKVLHLSNIPLDVEGDRLKEMFSKSGKVVNFRFFETNKKMALIEMSSVEEAISAMINMHNHHIDNGLHLRVSFTKSRV